MTEDNGWKDRIEDKLDVINEAIGKIAVQKQRLDRLDFDKTELSKSINAQWKVVRELQLDITRIKTKSNVFWALIIPIILVLVGLAARMFKLI